MLSSSMNYVYAVLVLAMMGVVFKKNYTPKRKDNMAPITVLLNFVQSLALFLSTDMSFSSSIRGTMKAASAASLDINMSTLECSEDSNIDTYGLLWYRIAMPFIFVGVFIVIYLGCHVYSIWWTKLNHLTKPHLGSHYLNSALLRSSMTILLFLYMPISTSILEYFDCVKAEDDTVRLERDRSELCYEGKHFEMLPMALLALSAFVIGIPVLLSVILIKCVKGKSMDDNVFELFGNLYMKYQPKYYLWEIIVMMRKISTVSLVVLLTTRPSSLSVGVLFVCLVYVCMLMRFTPYVVGIVNYADALGNCVLMVVLMVGSQTEYDSTERTFTDICVIGMIVLTVVLNIVSIVRYRKTETIYVSVAAARKKTMEASAPVTLYASEDNKDEVELETMTSVVDVEAQTNPKPLAADSPTDPSATTKLIRSTPEVESPKTPESVMTSEMNETKSN